MKFYLTFPKIHISNNSRTRHRYEGRPNSIAAFNCVVEFGFPLIPVTGSRIIRDIKHF